MSSALFFQYFLSLSNMHNDQIQTREQKRGKKRYYPKKINEKKTTWFCSLLHISMQHFLNPKFNSFIKYTNEWNIFFGLCLCAAVLWRSYVSKYALWSSVFQENAMLWCHRFNTSKLERILISIVCDKLHENAKEQQQIKEVCYC